MPELPEVEVIARALDRGGRGAPAIIGRHILAVRLDDPSVLQETSPAAFCRRLDGATLTQVSRRAKYLLLETSTGVLVAHLRMTGDLEVDEEPAGAKRFQRAALLLSDGLTLRFTDPRRLGRLWLTDDPAPLLAGLGPEPLDPALDAAALKARLAGTHRALKVALLDQTLLAGLGNIWADEALFRARLAPERPASSLDEREAERLLAGIREALHAAMESLERSLAWVHRGARDVEPPGQVHLRQGQPCPACGVRIARTRLGGRSTYSCPRCQGGATGRG